MNITKSGFMKFLSALLAASLIFTFLPFGTIQVSADKQKETYDVRVVKMTGKNHDKEEIAYGARVDIDHYKDDSDPNDFDFFINENVSETDGFARLGLAQYYHRKYDNYPDPNPEGYGSDNWGKEDKFTLSARVNYTGYHFSEEITPNEEYDGAFAEHKVVLEYTDLSKIIKIADGYSSTNTYIYDANKSYNPYEFFEINNSLGGLSTQIYDEQGNEFTDKFSAVGDYHFNAVFSGEGYCYKNNNGEFEDEYVLEFEVKILDNVRPDFKFDDDGPIDKPFDDPTLEFVSVNNPASSNTNPAKIDYHSSDKDNALVDTKGEVKIIKPGTYEIFATMAANDPYVASTIEYTIFAKLGLNLEFLENKYTLTYGEEIPENSIRYSIDHQTSNFFEDPAIEDLKFIYSIDDTKTTAKASINKDTGRVKVDSAGVVVVKAELDSDKYYLLNPLTYEYKIDKAIRGTLNDFSETVFNFGKEFDIFAESNIELPNDSYTTVSGEKYVSVDESNGKFSIIKAGGDFEIEVFIPEDDRYQALSGTIKGITVVVKQNVKFVKEDLIQDTGDNTYYVALDGDHYGASHVTCKWSGTSHYAEGEITNHNGKDCVKVVFKNNVTKQVEDVSWPGIVTITLVFDGDDNHLNTEIKAELNLQTDNTVSTEYELVDKDDNPIEPKNSPSNEFYNVDVKVKPKYANYVLNDNNERVSSYTLTDTGIYPKRETMFIYVNGKYKACNIGSIEEIKIDKDAPSLSIDISRAASTDPIFKDLLEGGIYYVFARNKVVVTVKTTDTLSGFDYIEYDYGDGDQIVDTFLNKPITDENGVEVVDINGEIIGTFEIPANKKEALQVWVFDRAGNYATTIGENGPINSDKITDEGKPLTYEDDDGNTQNISSDQKVIIVTDNQPPIVTVDFGTAKAVNEKYFNSERTAKITIEETNYFYDDVEINIEKLDGNNFVKISKDSSEYSNFVKTVDGSDNKEITVSFKEDGYYKFSVAYTDRSGNVAEPTYIGESCDEFVIDKTQSKVSVSFDDVKHNNEYFSAVRTATIVIDELNYSFKGLELDVTKRTGTEQSFISAVAGTDYEVTQDEKDPKTVYVKFSKDADYTFNVKYTDLAGNNDPKIGYNGAYANGFTIDTTLPVVSVKYSSDSDVKNVKYFNSDRKATITVNERNFDKSLVVLTSEGEVQTIKWDDEPELTETHTAHITFSKETKYFIVVSCSDKAGNACSSVDYGSIAPQEFIIDKTAPADEKMDIVIDNDSVKGSYNVVFDKFYQKTVKITLSAEDGETGIDFMDYQIVDNSGAFDKNAEWERYDKDVGITVNTGKKFILYFRATDMAGNEKTVNSTGIIVDDKAPEGEKNSPEISIVPLTAKNANGFYSGDVSVKISVVEPAYIGDTRNEAGYYSGLKEITYKIKATDTGAEVNGVLFSLSERTGFDKASFFTSNDKDKKELAHTWSDTIKIDAKTFNSNNVVIEVTAIDNAGNINTTTTTAGDYKIDITKPTIKISYNNNTADADNCFKAERVATIVITERNFNPADVKITLTSSAAGAMPEINGWAKSEGSGNGDGTTWTTTIPYTKDADYTFDIAYTDLAGNAADSIDYGNSVAPKGFTIDKTIPIITVRYDNNNATNDIYYNDTRTATVTIVEHNFDPARVNITLKATDDGKTIATPNISGWSHNGESHTITISYDKDGKYVFDISVKDKAGNDAADFAEQTFVVDTTVPVLKISGVKDASANNGDLAPEFTYSDTNYSEDLVYITFTGANQGKLEPDGTFTDIHNGKTFNFKNFPKQKVADDIYTLEITIIDLAGNESTQKVTFSVNRFGSTYDIDEAAKAINGTYVKTPVDIIVTEINPNALVDNELTIFKNNESITLVKGVDYDVEEVGGDGTWHEYRYKIHADVFKDDGVYKISIYSKDEAGNVSENTLDTKNAGLQFGVDATRPNIVATNLSSNKTYAVELYTVKLLVTDNLLLSGVEVYLDDYSTPYASWTAEQVAEIIKNNRDFTFDISDYSTSAHKVKVVGIDAAGNTQELEITNFYVTTNLFVRFYTNTPLFIGSIIGLLLIIALIVFIVVFKRRKTARR